MRLKTYRFFNMGIDHNYLDDARNRTLMQRAAAECYLPMNDLLLELIKSTGGRLRVSFYISGTALEQMRSYAPDVLRGFRNWPPPGAQSSSAAPTPIRSPLWRAERSSPPKCSAMRR